MRLLLRTTEERRYCWSTLFRLPPLTYRFTFNLKEMIICAGSALKPLDWKTKSLTSLTFVSTSLWCERRSRLFTRKLSGGSEECCATMLAALVSNSACGTTLKQWWLQLSNSIELRNQPRSPNPCQVPDVLSAFCSVLETETQVLLHH